MLLLSKMFLDLDCNLLEVNPWAITNHPESIFEDDFDKDMTCIDAKVIIDDNSLFRQKFCEQNNNNINYIDLENQGKIGCMVNGAGLAMATMDLIKLKG